MGLLLVSKTGPIARSDFPIPPGPSSGRVRRTARPVCTSPVWANRGQWRLYATKTRKAIWIHEIRAYGINADRFTTSDGWLILGSNALARAFRRDCRSPLRVRGRAGLVAEKVGNCRPEGARLPARTVVGLPLPSVGQARVAGRVPRQHPEPIQRRLRWVANRGRAVTRTHHPSGAPVCHPERTPMLLIPVATLTRARESVGPLYS